MRAIFSFWDCGKEYGAKSGFNSFEDFLYSITLAVNVARKNFSEVQLISNNFGIRVLSEELKLPFTSVNPLFEGIDLNPIFWGYTKMMAYASQDVPFVHIDNDAVLWNGVPKSLLYKPIFFQSIEDFERYPEWYGWYKPLLKICAKAPYFPQTILDNPTTISHNCGIVGANDLSIIKEWFDISTSYVKSEANKEFFTKGKNLLIHQNLMHEQYFISSILKRYDMSAKNGDVGVLLEDIRRPKNVKFTHLWGTVKRDYFIMRRLKLRVAADYPNYAKAISLMSNIIT